MLPVKSLATVVALAAARSCVAQEKITTEKFKAGIDAGSYDLVLDVRSQEERDAGHIPGTVHVPIDTFSEDDFWKNMEAAGYSCNKPCATVVAHCSIGGRAEMAIEKLLEMGFQGTLLNGLGTDQWTEAGYALVTEDDAPEPVCVSTDICAAKEVGKKITTEEFKAGIDAGSYDLVLDVRSQEERDAGHIPGTVHVPIETFSEDDFWKNMDADGYSCNKPCATVVAHCSIGGRAEMAIEKLQEMGFQGTLLNGLGTDQWTEAGYALVTEDDSPKPVCISSDICAAAKGSATGDADNDESSSVITGAGFGAAVVVPAVVALL